MRPKESIPSLTWFTWWNFLTTEHRTGSLTFPKVTYHFRLYRVSIRNSLSLNNIKPMLNIKHKGTGFVESNNQTPDDNGPIDAPAHSH